MEAILVRLQKDALDKAQALAWARNWLAKDPYEVCSIATSNPALLREWIDELMRWREQSRRETELFHEVIAHLRAAECLTIRGVAA